MRRYVSFRRTRRTRDEILNAVDSSKCLALGTRWAGDLESQVDDTISKVEPLVNGLMAGRVLHAEVAPAVLALGTLGTRIADAANEAQRHELEGGPADERLDLTEVADAFNELEEEFATEPAFDRQRTADALQRLKRARDALAGRTSRASDSRQDWSARVLDQARDSSRNGIARVNQANREHAARVAGRRTTDSVPFTPTPGRPPSIADINRMNRQNAQKFTDAQRGLIDDGDGWPPRAA